MYIFVSHSSTDFDIAQKVCKLIEDSGHQCFFAPRDIRTGREYAQELIDGIERADVVLLLLSKEANTSQHVLREIERAVSKRITIMVYKLEEVTLTKSMEYFLMAHQWINTKPGENYKEIVKCINEFEAFNEGWEKSVKAVDNGQKKRKAFLPILATFLVLILVGIGILTYGFIRDKKPVKVAPGDTIVFGMYNNEPIEWRVLKLSEDGTQAVVVSTNILTMKAFDAAESGRYNYYEGKNYGAENIEEESIELQHFLRGNNQWSASNIRTWLNATTEIVRYEDQPPRADAMSEFVNGYDAEPGFLSGFRKEELEAILITQVETVGTEEKLITEDKVFLLSSEELEWFYEADISLFALPTDAALTQDKSEWYEFDYSQNGVADYYWWLRDGDAESEYRALLVCNSYSREEIKSESVGMEGFGIRPAMTLDLTADCIVVK